MEYYTGIIFFESFTGITPKKYRNIKNVDSFLNFCRKINGLYVNLYEKKTKKFYCRIYLNQNPNI
jgi:hypothetical protein